MNDRKKSLELFAKSVSEGLPFAEDLIDKDENIQRNALLARNLSEDTLAQQVLKNTGIPIPHDGASIAKKEDFLNQIVQERYPEFKNPNVSVADLSGAHADYGKGNIRVDRNQLNDITQATGKALHEAGHRYDDEILGHLGKNLDLSELRKAKNSGIDLKKLDPAQVYELYSKSHHAEIPNLREGSFGYGALKSMLKSGNFKGIAPIGLGTAIGAAVLPEDANASDLIPVLDQASNAGDPLEDRMIMEEVKARQNYERSPARLDALKALAGKK